MTEEFYERLETETAKNALMALSKQLPEPVVVLGGWAVYLSVRPPPVFKPPNDLR
jgi:hypothetical protein